MFANTVCTHLYLSHVGLGGVWRLRAALGFNNQLCPQGGALASPELGSCCGDSRCCLAVAHPDSSLLPLLSRFALCFCPDPEMLMVSTGLRSISPQRKGPEQRSHTSPLLRWRTPYKQLPLGDQYLFLDQDSGRHSCILRSPVGRGCTQATPLGAPLSQQREMLSLES